MSNQCKNCDRERDLNNNYVGYPNNYAMPNQNNNNNNRNSSSANSTSATQGPKITAKVMFGSVGAIKELREKEHAEKARSTQTGRRQ